MSDVICILHHRITRSLYSGDSIYVVFYCCGKDHDQKQHGGGGDISLLLQIAVHRCGWPRREGMAKPQRSAAAVLARPLCSIGFLITL